MYIRCVFTMEWQYKVQSSWTYVSQKFKIDLKCPPFPRYQCCNKKNDRKHLRTTLLYININKGRRGFMCFDFLPHYYVHDCRED